MLNQNAKTAKRSLTDADINEMFRNAGRAMAQKNQELVRKADYISEETKAAMLGPHDGYPVLPGTYVDSFKGKSLTGAQTAYKRFLKVMSDTKDVRPNFDVISVNVAEEFDGWTIVATYSL